MADEPPCIACMGSIMCDITSYVPRIPKAGESLLGCKTITGNGGKGANAAVAAAQLGARVKLIGKIGKDPFAQMTLKNLKERNIIRDYVYQTSEESTGTAVIMVEESGENRILVDLAANALLTPEEVLKAEDGIKDCKVFACNLEMSKSACKMGLQLAKKHGVTTILNAAPVSSDLDPEFYSLADICCVNEIEGEIITGLSATQENYKLMCYSLLKRGCKNVVLTLGSNGAVFASKDHPDCVSIPPKKVNPVDTTGAGDAFVGALAYYLAYHPNLTMETKVQRACIYASLSVEKRGTQTSYLGRNELSPELFL